MGILREPVASGSEEALRIWGEIDRRRMECVDAYLGLRGAWNITELSDVSQQQMDLYHWDLVQIQRAEYGGGTISFDGEPIRVDGRFVPSELKDLDPPESRG
jgi:hypothetical protein